MEGKPHHHGNLRAALIEAGVRLLAEGGIEGLGLRRAAALAGVSHAAPAHHFRSKQGLVLAIAAHGFTIFRRCMEEDRFRHGEAPHEQLRGICDGYLRFASDHEALFRLIFTAAIKGDPDPEVQKAGQAAFQVLADVCALFEPSPAGEGVNEITIWSLVHGYAALRRFPHVKNPATGLAVPFESIMPKMQPRAG